MNNKFIILLFLIAQFVHAQQPENFYFAQKSPTLTPAIFAPGNVSHSDRYEFGSIFSADGKEFFLGVDHGDKSVIYQYRLVNGKWSEPKVIIDLGEFGFNDPMLSPNEDRLYFISKYTEDSNKAYKDHDIWYVARTKTGWSLPINAGPNINSDLNEYYMSFTVEGHMYFGSNKGTPEDQSFNYDIYKSEWKNGAFQPASVLPKEINTNRYEADVFVAPDESYVIFCGIRKDGLGQGDLYISFKQNDGSWSQSKNMGDRINTAQHELCPFVTKDGKYLFFTSDKDIYWVDARVIDTYR